MPIKQTADGRYEVRVCVQYRRVHRCLPAGASARDAKRLEADLISALSKNQEPVIPGDPSMRAVMAIYLAEVDGLRSPDTARHHANRIGKWCELYRASQARQCASHIARDLKKVYSAATINRSLGALKKGLRLAWEQGLTGENYGAHVKRLAENNSRDEPPTLEEVKRIADAASQNVKAAIWIALLTGCRRGEVCQIEAKHIGPDTIQVPAGNTKTLRTRTVPILPALREFLPMLPLPINFEGVKSGFRRAREKAGLPEVHFHDLRHACATLLLSMDVPLDVIRDILGHSTIKTTERYSHAIVARQRAALSKLSDLHADLHFVGPKAA